MSILITVWVTTKKGNDFQVQLPGKRIVCPCCDGKGTHVNPNIDGDGINPQEFHDDPDFAESYFRGDYDVECEYCKGRNVVEVVDEEKLTPKMKDRYFRNLDINEADRRMAEAERRMGA